MASREAVIATHQALCSGNRGKDGISFVRCVDGQEPQIHKLWSFAEDGINRKIHPFARVDVGNFSEDCFQTLYMTEEARRVNIFGQISINMRMEWLSTPVPSSYMFASSLFILLSCCIYEESFGFLWLEMF